MRWFADPGVPVDESRGMWRSLGARVVAEALGAGGRGPGPVHLNLPFRDPLVGDAGPMPADVPRDVRGTRSSRTAPGSTMRPSTSWPRCSMPCGASSSRGAAREVAGVHTLAERLGWPVLADPRSGARLPARTTVAAFDALLRHPQFARDHRPEVVLRLGEPPASKVLAQWLASSRAREVVVARRGAWIDPDASAELIVVADPARVVAALTKRLSGSAASGTPWLARWSRAEAVAQLAIDEALSTLDGDTEPGVARGGVGGAPRRRGARGLVVDARARRRVVRRSPLGRRVYSNRGANGIDGVLSTAVGVALARGAPTAVLIGDVALLHDTNGCSAPRHATRPDDRGRRQRRGRHLLVPPAGDELGPETFEQLFGTPHGVDLVALAAVHGIPEVDAVGRGTGVRLVRVQTDRAENVRAHDAINRAVVDALG